jgi:hypothetical protein
VFADAVLLGDIQSQERPREPEHHSVRAPVGQVQVGVVVALHQPAGIAAEVAPVVLVRETRGGDPGPGGQLADLGLLGVIQRAPDGQELVVLVFAHVRFLYSGAHRR